MRRPRRPFALFTCCGSVIWFSEYFLLVGGIFVPIIARISMQVILETKEPHRNQVLGTKIMLLIGATKHLLAFITHFRCYHGNSFSWTSFETSTFAAFCEVLRSADSIICAEETRLRPLTWKREPISTLIAFKGF